jgi:hypothetical protein
MGTTLRFDRSHKDQNEVKQVTISCRGTLAMDADLITAATRLNFKNKSELVHDICERFIEQLFRQRRQLHALRPAQMNRLDRVQVTRECIGKISEYSQLLDQIWNGPEPSQEQKRTA